MCVSVCECVSVCVHAHVPSGQFLGLSVDTALNGFHSQNGLLEASGRREAKPSAPVQPEEDVDRRPQLCWKGAGAQRGARNGLSGSSKLAAISIRLGQLCLESVWLSLARLAW